MSNTNIISDDQKRRAREWEQRYFKRILEVSKAPREDYEFVCDGDHETLRIVKIVLPKSR